MTSFMGPMAPPQAAQPQPQKLDIRTNPSQRQQFKQFMRQRSAVMPMQPSPMSQAPMMPPMQPAPVRLEMGGSVDIFDPMYAAPMMAPPAPMGFGHGGDVPPRRADIRGQDHMLSYITPDEADILEALGGSGEAGPMGIPAFPPGFGSERSGFGSERAGGAAGGPSGAFGGGGGNQNNDRPSDNVTSRPDRPMSPGRSAAEFGTQEFAGITSDEAKEILGEGGGSDQAQQIQQNIQAQTFANIEAQRQQNIADAFAAQRALEARQFQEAQEARDIADQFERSIQNARIMAEGYADMPDELQGSSFERTGLGPLAATNIGIGSIDPVFTGTLPTGRVTKNQSLLGDLFELDKLIGDDVGTTGPFTPATAASVLQGPPSYSQIQRVKAGPGRSSVTAALDYPGVNRDTLATGVIPRDQSQVLLSDLTADPSGTERFGANYLPDLIEPLDSMNTGIDMDLNKKRNQAISPLTLESRRIDRDLTMNPADTIGFYDGSVPANIFDPSVVPIGMKEAMAVEQSNQPPTGTISMTRQKGPGDDTSSMELFETLNPVTQDAIIRGVQSPLQQTMQSHFDPSFMGEENLDATQTDLKSLFGEDSETYKNIMERATPIQSDAFPTAAGIVGKVMGGANVQNIINKINEGGVPQLDAQGNIQGVVHEGIIPGTQVYTGNEGFNPFAGPKPEKDSPSDNRTGIAQYDPCPDGFKLVNGVCTPVDQAASPDSPPNQIGGGTPVPYVPPPVVVASTRQQNLPTNMQGPVGYGTPVAGQAAPSVASNAAFFQQMLNQQGQRSPLRLQDGGSVSTALDQAAGNFLKALQPAA